jgi:hypothetical protein
LKKLKKIFHSALSTQFKKTDEEKKEKNLLEKNELIKGT